MEKWSKVASKASLPGAAAIIPILTGTCGGKYAQIYSDKKMIYPLPNPFYPQERNTFVVFTPSECIRIEEGGK